MKPFVPQLVLCTVLSLAAVPVFAGGSVELTYQNPDKFTDLQSTWFADKSLLDGLSDHFRRLAEKGLLEGQVLQIEVVDVDLAGSIEYRRQLPPIRVMRDVTSPRITLRYQLKSTNTAPMTEVTLRDMAYLARINRYADGDPLRYEKQMLDDWFRNAFSTPR